LVSPLSDRLEALGIAESESFASHGDLVEERAKTNGWFRRSPGKNMCNRDKPFPR